jgi:hypothetical protein
VFAEFGVKGRIIIKSPDVLVLCVHYFSKLQHTQELWFQTGTPQFPVLRTGGAISQYMRFVAPLVPFSPAAHAVTCCDTTSSLFGIGKRSGTCCLKVASHGGSLARHALFTVANLVLNLFKFSSLALIFPLESYSFITNRLMF